MAMKTNRTGMVFGLCFLFTMVGWYFRSDMWHTDHEFSTAYSVSLGATCESDIKTCKIKTNDPIGYRPELSRDEVVSMNFAGKADIEIYRNCLIWDALNWECENAKIMMRYGVIDHNDFEPSKDIYYVPHLAWKMAKLHVLPLDTVRDAPPPERQKKGA